MHLGGSRLLEHRHDAPRGRAPHDRVVDQHHALAPDDGPHGRKLHPDTLLAQLLRRLDEGAADVLVLDQAHLVGQAARLGIAHRGAEARIGHADDDVGIDRCLAIEQPSRLLAVGVDVAPLDVAVGTGEVDVLHRAHLVALVHRVVAAADALVVDRDDLARLDVAHELGTQARRRRRSRSKRPSRRPAVRSTADAARTCRGRHRCGWPS